MPSLASASHSVLANCHAITSRDAVLTLCSPRRRVLSSRTFQAPDATEHAGFSRAAVAASSSPCEISAVCVACSPLLMCVPRSSAPCCPCPSHVILQIIFVARLPRALRKIVLARPSPPFNPNAHVGQSALMSYVSCVCVRVCARVLARVFASFCVRVHRTFVSEPSVSAPNMYLYTCMYIYIHVYEFLNQVINPTSLAPLARKCLGAYAYPSRSFFYPQV